MPEYTVQRTGLTAQVYDRLIECIVDRTFLPGQRLSIDQLARELSVSATPVREALARLSSHRLVEFEAYKGYSVLPAMDSARLDQLFDVRIMIETSAGNASIACVYDAQIATLHQIVAAMRSLTPGERYGEFREFNNRDRDFHHALVAISGNDFLIDMYDALSPHIHIARFYHERNVRNTQPIYEEHMAIIDAYEQRDGDRVDEFIRRHLVRAKARLKETLPNGVLVLSGVEESLTTFANEQEVNVTAFA